MRPDGLHVQLEAISPDLETGLVVQIQDLLSNVPQTGANERSRIARFGWDYTPNKQWLGDAPDWVYVPGIAKSYESVTINEYHAGHGIGAHIDSEDFDEPILILSLNTDGTMLFESTTNDCLFLNVPRRTLLTLKGDARYKWTHAVTGQHKNIRYSIVARRRLTDK
jgi:hypothetical protein